MRLVLISDTHGQHRKLSMPDGDILIHAGDFTDFGSERHFLDFNNWLGGLDYKHKIVVAGNHETLLDRRPERAKELTNCVYLQDSSVEVEGLKIHGSPWNTKLEGFGFYTPFPEMEKKLKLVPNDIDILITHVPPLGILDCGIWGDQLGCSKILDRIINVKPKLHVFGHVHSAYGITQTKQTTFVNASCLGAGDEIESKSFVVDL